MKTPLKLILVINLLLFSIAHSYAQTNTRPRKTQLVNGANISYVDKGMGHTLLFIHGIPSNADIWRNIIDTLSLRYRTIAIDLPGYGKSDMPANYSVENNYNYVKLFIDSLKLEDITIVVHDLGSLYGIKYAVENPDRIKNIVMLESVFMPTKEWYRQLPISAKLMFSFLHHNNISRKLIYNKSIIPTMMLKMGTMRKLTPKEIKSYTEGFDDSCSRRLILLKGPSPVTMPKQGITKHKGDFADEFDRNALGLQKLSATKSILILYASPGMVTRKKAIQYAQNNFKNLTLGYLGKGKHFLQEDFPKEISIQVLNWLHLN